MDNASSVKTAVIFIGIPASGKTAFFAEYYVKLDDGGFIVEEWKNEIIYSIEYSVNKEQQ